MADRPSTSASGVGRPRMKSTHLTSCVLVVKPKTVRPRSMSAHTSKVSDSPKREKVKKTPMRVKQVTVIEIDSDL